MKMLLRPFFALALITVLLESCSDNSEEVIGRGEIMAKIDGVSFTAPGGAIIYDNKIIVGGNVENENLSLFISKDSKAGTYEITAPPPSGGNAADAEINYTPDGIYLFTSINALMDEKAGTVTITEINEVKKTISGTFSSRVIRDGGAFIQITDGSFDRLPYVTNPENTLTAKVDGQTFIATKAAGRKPMTSISIDSESFKDGLKTISLFALEHDIRPGIYQIGEPGDDIWAGYGFI